jgi:hypothetical protein
LSIKRRKKWEEEYSYKSSNANTSITESIRDFFCERQVNNENMSYNEDKGDMPLLAWEEEDSSSSNNSKDSNDSFMTDLTDVFHSCK